MFPVLYYVLWLSAAFCFWKSYRAFRSFNQQIDWSDPPLLRQDQGPEYRAALRKALGWTFLGGFICVASVIIKVLESK
jgi:hypothetical protein